MYTTRKVHFSRVICMMMLFIFVLITPAFAGTTNNPAISVAVSPSTITKGDTLHITGAATGNPSNGVAIWVMCKEYANLVTIQPDSNGIFKYELESATTSALPGVCYVVAQHPMQNNQFDIYLKSSTVGGTGYGEVYNRLIDTPVKIDASHIFKIFGLGSIQVSDAEWYLTEALKDPNVDDSYAETQFTVVAPTTTSSIPTATTTVTTTAAIPTVSGISPTSGSTLGGTVVTITGSGFSSVGVSWVKFGSTQVGVMGVYNTGGSTGSVTAISPAGSTGTVDITVITTSGTTATSAATKYTYTTPITTVPTTVTTTSPTTPVTTILTTATTSVPTTQVTSVPTTVTIIPPTSQVTTVSTNNIEKLLEEQNKKIDDQNKLIAEQNKKIAEQSDLLSQLLSYFKGIFGWN